MTASATNGTSQWVKRWNVQSDRKGKDGQPIVYVVGRTASGSFGCSCPAWKFQKAPRDDCKHITMIRRMIQLHDITNAQLRPSQQSAEAFAAEEEQRISRCLEVGREVSKRMREESGTAAKSNPATASKPRRKFRFTEES